MVRVATVATSFHARVIAARLACEGMTTELRGNVDGLYPIGDVHVFVDEIDLPGAQELLLVDEVESAFDDPYECERPARPEMWMVVGALVLMAMALFVRTF
jgi:hypothetical protein